MENKAKEYYISREQYLTLKAKWAENNNHPAWQHIIYNILRNKPIDSGFTEKKKAIQCNDPWWGFNSALSEARHYCPGEICPYDKDKFPSGYERWTKRSEEYQKLAEKIFGITIPGDIRTKMDGYKK
jgi:hypothetical protein